MDEKWEFDAPQFIDFTQPHEFEHVYDDTWFDRHTEDEELLGLAEEGVDRDGTGNAKKSYREKPQRILKDSVQACDKKQVDVVDTGSKSPRTAKPERVPVGEKHGPHGSSKNICPSPKKRQRLSPGAISIVDPTSPAANTRLQSKYPNVKSDVDSLVSNSSSDASHKLHSTNASNAKSVSHVKTKKTQPEAQQGGQFASRVQVKSAEKLPKSSGRSKARSPSKPVSPRALNQTASSINRTTRGKPQMSGSLTRSNSMRVKSLSKAISTGTLKPVPNGKLSNCDSGSTTSLNKGKTTEQLELEKIAAIKKEVARTRKLAQDSYKKAMTSHAHIPLRSKQPATLPQGFHFKTDGRIKNTDNHTNDQKVKDFTKSLREALPQPTLPTRPQVQCLTRPQPFKLTSAKSTSSLQQGAKYESVAEKMAAFYKKTPDRFRSRPHGSKERSRSATKSDASGKDTRLRSQSPKLTIAKTPNLTARGRTRTVTALSREEKEQLEWEEHQKQQFKANPVNHRIFEVSQVGVPKVPSKPLTVTEEFNLHSKSVSTGDLRRPEEEERYEFHAKPVNPKILQGPVGVKPVEPQSITIPESPAFALKNRVRRPVEVTEEEEIMNVVKANPVRYTGIPFKPRLAHHRTVPEPFTVEERSKQMLSKREQKIQQILEEERKAREFQAQGLPSDSPDALPPKQPRPLTMPEPFHLGVDERGQKYQEEFRAKQIEEEERLAREAAQFKARSNDVIHKDPFLPLKSSKPLTALQFHSPEISDFALNTDVRATHREAYDQHLKAREAEIEALKRQREERMEMEEKAAIARLRQEAVHKASGVKKYKNIIVKPSDKPLTDAQSPRFSQRIRSKPHETDV